MRNTLYLWAILLLLLPNEAFSQSKDDPHGIAARAVFHNYEWPLSTVKDLRASDFNSGFEFEYYRFLSDRFNISFPLRINNGLLLIDENGSRYKAGSIGLDVLLNWKLITDGWFRPHLFAGSGLLAEDIKEVNVAIPMGLGFNFQLGRNSFFSLTTAYKLSLKDYRNHLQLGAGLRFNIAPKKPSKKLISEEELLDKDLDGIVDQEDLCPEVAGSLKMQGCPDKDDDGVVDSSDHCPEIPGSKFLNGCPDSDHDGLVDKEDDCPEQAGPVSNSGCPYYHQVKEADNAQGIIHGSDEKTKQVEEAQENNPIRIDDVPQGSNLSQQGQAPQQGISAQESFVDSDLDGIPNYLDACPFNKGDASNKGCPSVTKTDRKILIDAVQTVKFETASAIITKDSYGILNDVVAVMGRNPSYSLQIDGHTDSIGSRKSNQFLSERRALACYNYLLMKGVSPARMSYAGFGESRPIENNTFNPGRELNRRVDFNLFIK